MIRVVVHHDHKQLPDASETVVPVQLYGLNGINYIGSPVIEKIKRLGVKVSSTAIDFLSIALAITAADTFVKREDAADGWAREITIQMPLAEPEPWNNVKVKLEKALRFLSGDIWQFEFTNDGFKPPNPYRQYDRFHLVKLRSLDSVSLFSGGLDSAIGVIDLLSDGRKPLLISHAYPKDHTCQEAIAGHLKGRFSRFSVNAHPISANGETDVSMRTRSINFLAFAAVGACAVQTVNQMSRVELFVPENGFISLNAPLTTRRIGSLSTRTTHPHFLGLIQEIFNDVDIECDILNPYQFQTKGEMVGSCRDQSILQSVFQNTVSCSHWKRKNKQCGCCVPCIIRRAALRKANFNEQQDTYIYDLLKTVLLETDKRDDLRALSIAIEQIATRSIGPWILNSGPLTRADFNRYQHVFVNGLKEVEVFLQNEGIQ